jgi:predicted ATPase
LGREDEVREICALLRHKDVRLVTLTGPGGIGKTHLALQVGAEMVNMFADGVWFVSLSRLADPALVLPTIAQTLGLQEAAGHPLSAFLRDHVRMRQLLLVLDNFEQVVEAAPAVAELLARSPGLMALVTSRMALRLQGEREYPIPSLALPVVRPPARPPSIEEVMDSPAVALFVARALAHAPNFHLTRATAPIVAAICARLDGLPLAITLAAAQIKVLPAPALLRRLEPRLPLLTGGARDLPERQHTMRATLDWSYDLLPPEEQRLFRRLAIFVGGFTLEATEVICAAPEGAEPLGLDVLEGLGTLVDQSLVQQLVGDEAEGEGGEARFRLLYVVREYALERLEASGEADALRRAHAQYYLGQVEERALAVWGAGSGSWMAWLEREHDNFRAALGWTQEKGEAEIGLRLVGALGRFWAVRGHLREGRAWVEGLLTLGGGSEAVRARALFVGGLLTMWQGDLAAAVRWLEQATALARAVGDQRTAASALNALGTIDLHRNDMQGAEARYEESLALMRQAEDQRGIAAALLNLGVSVFYQGNLERADASFVEALALFREVGDRNSIAVALADRGGVARRRGEGPQALALGREALALAHELDDPRRCADILEELAKTLAATGQGDQSARLLGAATALRETLGAPLPSHERADVEQEVAAARAAVGEEAWEASFMAGRALSLEEAIAEALGEDGLADESAPEQ